jgi:hypothetical protein
MGLRDLLKDRKSVLSDKDIVTDMLKDSNSDDRSDFALEGVHQPQLRLLLRACSPAAPRPPALTDLAMTKDCTPSLRLVDQIRMHSSTGTARCS